MKCHQEHLTLFLRFLSQKGVFIIGSLVVSSIRKYRRYKISFLYFNKIDLYVFYKIDGQTVRKRSDIVTLVISKKLYLLIEKMTILISRIFSKPYFFTSYVKNHRNRTKVWYWFVHRYSSSKKWHNSNTSHRKSDKIRMHLTENGSIRKKFRRKVCMVILEYILEHS